MMNQEELLQAARDWDDEAEALGTAAAICEAYEQHWLASVIAGLSAELRQNAQIMRQRASETYADTR